MTMLPMYHSYRQNFANIDRHNLFIKAATTLRCVILLHGMFGHPSEVATSYLTDECKFSVLFHKFSVNGAQPFDYIK